MMLSALSPEPGPLISLRESGTERRVCALKLEAPALTSTAGLLRVVAA